ncbi:MAG TPA: phosphoenolpyruvate--protein phosphotransferase [Myxococcota bacterium]|nr:phosphoenolpyruvate--protein phosphotransferase [Myxococcota bacterium]
MDRVTLLADVAGIVSRSHDLDETLGNVVDLVAKRLDADVCSVYLNDTDLRHLTLRATRGLARESIGRVRLAFGEGLVGLAAKSAQPVATDDAPAHPAYRYFPETGEERFHSFLAAPLIVSGVSIGVITVQTMLQRSFDPQDVELLQTCAQLIAPVVMNAQLLALVASTQEDQSRIAAELASSGVRTAALRLAPPPPAPNLAVKGSATSRGVAIGPIYFLEDPLDLERIEYEPSPDAAQEHRDLLGALESARRELDDTRDEVGERFGPEFSAVFNTHIQILEDKGFVAKLENAVRESRNALRALRDVAGAYRKMFENIEDPFFRDRGIDVEDVTRRVMAQLLGVRHQNIPLSDGAILVTSHLLPAHFAWLETEKIAAIVAEHGGPTSHGAIFARALEIPAVTGAKGIIAASRPGQLAIVDGGSGIVYLDPDEPLRAEYERAQHRYELAVEHLDALAGRPAETRDGHRVALTANVGLIADLRLCERHGAEGIGLFRTELLVLAQRGMPPEEEQEQLYTRIAEALAPQRVTIRTLDLGGDKAIPNLGMEREDNPQLGLRSIRLSLAHEGVFRAQLRAILRASAGKNVRMLLPMISSLAELRRAHELVAAAKEELARRGSEFDPDVPVGVMIEVPGAALIADALAREADFFSIGTNDLTQYTLAVDRGNERVAHLYDPLHPGVLRLIDRTVRAARKLHRPVSVCGEMASNPLAVPILVGLGIEELSGAASAVPVVKEIVRSLDAHDVAQDARAALEAGTAAEVHAISARRLRETGLLDHPDIGSWLAGVVANGDAATKEGVKPLL